MKSTILLIALLPALPACVAGPGARGVEGAVRIGQTAYVGGPRVRPERVLEDSRCPMNARCIWAGRVIVQAAVATGRGSQRLNLTLGEPKRVADGMLTLVSVTPERTTGAAMRPSSYRFTFDFKGGF